MIIRLISKKYYASLTADHPNFCIETTLTSPDSTDVTTIQIIQAVSTYFEGDFYGQSWGKHAVGQHVSGRWWLSDFYLRRCQAAKWVEEETIQGLFRGLSYYHFIIFIDWTLHKQRVKLVEN